MKTQGTLAIVDSRYRVKTNKTRNTAIVGSRYRVNTNKTRNTDNSKLKIQSEDKQNKEHWQ